MTNMDKLYEAVGYRILGNTAVFKQKATTQTFLESLGFAAR